MGRITDNDRKNLVQVDNYDRARILYKYLAEGKKQALIAEEVYHNYDDWASQSISLVTRAFGFHNQAGKGKYRQVPKKAFEDFVDEFYPEEYNGGLAAGTFDRWLKEWYNRAKTQPAMDDEEDYEDDEPIYIPTYTPTPRPTPNPIPRPTPTPRPTPPMGGGGGAPRQRTYVSSTPNLGPFAPILLLVAVCVLLWGGSKAVDLGRGAIFSGRQMLGNVNNFLSAEYNAEIFEYEGAEFIGNRRFNKPEGACMRLDGGMDYTIGYFEEETLDGYGIIVKDDGQDLKAGVFKENALNGYAILRCNGVDYVANFKKGVANGYGYCYNRGTEQIVKFKKVSADLVNFTATEVVAERQGDSWVKPNGKILKMKDNTYKGITWLREGLIAIGDVEYFFDAEMGEAYYDGPETRLSWDMEGCEYDSILSDDEGTWLYYTTGEGLMGKHQYYEKKDLLINTFEVGISVD